MELSGDSAVPTVAQPYTGYTDQNYRAEAEGSTPGVQNNAKGYYGGRQYSEAPGYPPAPQELSTPNTVHEMEDTATTTSSGYRSEKRR